MKSKVILIFLLVSFIQCECERFLKCKRCSSDESRCLICDDYFIYTYIDNEEGSVTYGQCILCPPNCKNCDSNGCLSCYNEHGPNEKGECVKCEDPDCFRCPQNYKVCTQCKYTDAKDGKCQGCDDPNCIICRDSIYKCVSCNTGYQLENGKCTLIKEPCKTSNCADCSEDRETCYKCESSFYLNHEQICQKCPPNCNECNETKCIKCQALYGFNDKGECVQCEDILCAYCFDDYKKCTMCRNFFDFKITSDYKCEFDCADENCYLDKCSATNTSKCTKCNDGFSLNENGVCIACNVKNCKSCNSNINKCYDCNDGFYSSDDSNECLTYDDPHCIDSNCRSCIDGYVKSDGECKKCKDDNCKRCTNNTLYCTQCKEGYNFLMEKGSPDYSKCVPCSVENCLSCYYRFDWCTSCKYGFIYYDGQCITKREYIIREGLIPPDDDDDDEDKTSTINSVECGSDAPIGCLRCLESNNNECLICDTSLNFKNEPDASGMCPCKGNFVLSVNGECFEEILKIPPNSFTENKNIEDLPNVCITTIDSSLIIDTSSLIYTYDENNLYAVRIDDEVNEIDVDVNSFENVQLNANERKDKEMSVSIKPNQKILLDISNSHFPINLPSNSQNISLKAEEYESQLTIGSTDDKNEVYLRNITISKNDFSFIPKVNVIVDTINLFSEAVLSIDYTIDGLNVTAMKINVQRGSQSQISNVFISEQLNMAPNSLIKIDENVIFDKAKLIIYKENQQKIGYTFIEFKQKVTQCPSLIQINEMNESEYLSESEDRIIILHQNPSIFDNEMCNNWAEKVDTTNGYSGYCVINDKLNDGDNSVYAKRLIQKGKKKSKGLGAGAIAGIVVGCVVFIAIIALILFFVIKKKKQHNLSKSLDENNESESVGF